MRLNFQLFLLLCILTVAAHGQEAQLPSLNIGDTAPPLRLRGWLKGAPIQRFEKGQVYVVEFWATWCKPCIAAMPHLSALASEYMDKVTFLGVAIYEKEVTSMEKIKGFVDSLGHRMEYRVAAEDSNFMATGWLDAFGEQGIPKTFIVNTEGRVAWIGHPKDLTNVLSKIVSNTWEIKEALDKRNLDRYLEQMDREAFYELIPYMGDERYKPGDLGKPDSALLLISEIIKKEPKLKYATAIASCTFSSLLRTDPHKAYEYGNMVIVTPTYEEPAYSSIIGSIEWHSDKLNLPAEIYRLGAEACQLEIDQIPYPEIVNMSKRYSKMAEWYWRACDKSKAIEAQRKAIEALKTEKDFSNTTMMELESRLQQYKRDVSR
jgi:thiol-disulfide isomerase/thioredoxin